MIMISIVLAEDHQMVRQGFRLLLAAQKDFQVVGEAGDGLEAARLVEELQPNILVLDLMIPRLHGLDLLRRIRKDSPKTKGIVLSMHDDEPYVMEALRSGAQGYVLKGGSAAELVTAIRTVIAGRRHLPTDLTGKVLATEMENHDTPSLDAFDTLTKRERLILQLAAEGHTNPAVAAKLFISPRTAEKHRANLMRKLSLRSQTDLVRFAIRRGLLAA